MSLGSIRSTTRRNSNEPSTISQCVIWRYPFTTINSAFPTRPCGRMHRSPSRIGKISICQSAKNVRRSKIAVASSSGQRRNTANTFMLSLPRIIKGRPSQQTSTTSKRRRWGVLQRAIQRGPSDLGSAHPMVGILLDDLESALNCEPSQIMQLSFRLLVDGAYAHVQCGSLQDVAPKGSFVGEFLSGRFARSNSWQPDYDWPLVDIAIGTEQRGVDEESVRCCERAMSAMNVAEYMELRLQLQHSIQKGMTTVVELGT